MSTIKSSAENLTLNADGANNDVIIQSNGSTKVTVDGQNSRVGIGETSPDTLLHLTSNASSSQGIKIENTSGSTNGDAILQFTTPSISTTLGIDGTGTDVFKISNGTALGTNDVLTINSSNNVGIGTVTPARKLHVNSSDANVASFEGHQGEGLVISSGTNGQIDIIGYDDGASAYNPIVIRAGSSGIRVTSDGLCFGSDTAAANALDDYEEGTWTPTWSGANSSSATYTKIGRVVYASGQFAGTGSGTSGACGGLPYASAIDGSDGGGSGYHGQDAVTWSVLKISSTGFRFYTGSSQKQIADSNPVRFFLTYHV